MSSTPTTVLTNQECNHEPSPWYRERREQGGETISVSICRLCNAFIWRGTRKTVTGILSPGEQAGVGVRPLSPGKNNQP